MSGIRPDRCGEPGPGEAHCSDFPLHDYSCYDGGDDVSFNGRQWFVHSCTDPNCPNPHFENEGD